MIVVFLCSKFDSSSHYEDHIQKVILIRSEWIDFLEESQSVMLQECVFVSSTIRPTASGSVLSSVTAQLQIFQLNTQILRFLGKFWQI